jgi:hypothetical protein
MRRRIGARLRRCCSVRSIVARLARLSCRDCAIGAVRRQQWQHGRPSRNGAHVYSSAAGRRPGRCKPAPVEARVGPQGSLPLCQHPRRGETPTRGVRAEHGFAMTRLPDFAFGWRSFGARAPSLFDIPRGSARATEKVCSNRCHSRPCAEDPRFNKLRGMSFAARNTTLAWRSKRQTGSSGHAEGMLPAWARG